MPHSISPDELKRQAALHAVASVQDGMIVGLGTGSTAAWAVKLLGEKVAEVDFVLPGKGGGVRLIEAKATRTPVPGMAAPMLRLAEAWSATHRAKGTVAMTLVHEPSTAGVVGATVARGVKALPWREFLKTLPG